MQNMAEAGQLHKSIPPPFCRGKKGTDEALKLMVSAFAAFVFRNVLRC
jgi:hypothetical protein